MEQFCTNLSGNPMVVCLYFAVLLLLVVLIFWSTKSEGLIGTGLGRGAPTDTRLSDYSSEAAALTSGAKARRLAQEFSQPNQGNYTTTHLHDAQSVMERIQPKGAGESLVSERGEPDFWAKFYLVAYMRNFQQDYVLNNLSKQVTLLLEQYRKN